MKTHLNAALLIACWCFAALSGAGLAAREPDTRWQGDALPVPPQQSSPWTPPKTRLSSRLIAATRTLFAQGLADPRGCEYREIATVNDRSDQTEGPLESHGWVLPPDPKRPGKFAILWDGLVYPAVHVGRAADLRADVTKGGENIQMGLLGTCLLLRLGQGRLAEQTFAKNSQQGASGDAAGLSGSKWNECCDPYLLLAGEWLHSLYDRAMFAHGSGDDALALASARMLVRVWPAVETEATDLDFPHEDSDPPQDSNSETMPLYFQGFGPISAILADQERRATERRQKTGPPVHYNDVDWTGGIDAFWRDVERKLGRRLDERHRIALVIAWFEESEESEHSLADLLRPCRDEAVEPLLDSLLHDRRLSRSGQFGGSVGVTPDDAGKVAYEVLCLLLETRFDNSGFGSTLNDRPALAQRIRAQWLKIRNLSPVDGWFKVLSDDAEPPDRWVEAVQRTVVPVCIHEYDVDDPAARRKAMREKRHPSMTELLVKRATALTRRDALPEATQIALALAEWEPAAALPVLRQLSARLRVKCRDKARRFPNLPDEIVQLTLARAKLKDRGALPEYAQFLREVSFKDGDITSSIFEPLLQYPDDPAVAAGADWVFNDPSSPWHTMLVEDGQNAGQPAGFQLGRNPLLELPAFRKLVLHALEDVSATPIRHCDMCAHGLSEIDGMPRCEFDWPEPRRDRAVAECRRLLDQYGRLLTVARGQRAHGQMQFAFPALDRPATKEDVRGGRAIFSLEGEGPARSCALLARPADARWITNRENPYVEHDYDAANEKDVPRVAYHQEGTVWQAEELLVNGKWQRYYGFAGAGHLTKVPAEEIEFTIPGTPWDKSFNFELDRGNQLVLMNRAGLPQTTPGFHAADDAAPASAGAAVVEFHLYRYAGWRAEPPWDASPDFAAPAPGEDSQWREIPKKPAARLKFAPLPARLRPLEAVAVFKMDLSDNYPQLAAGTYRCLVAITTIRDKVKTVLRLAGDSFTVSKPPPPGVEKPAPSPENRGQPQGDDPFGT